ncbi:MAG: histidine kinase dimerization/phosphoacceptor domain -containing protein [Balneola sp.]
MVYSVVKDNSGEIVTVMSLVEDITEKKKADEIIENSLKEKTTLLSEIHHRVKNNLAIVSGLLQLQMNEVQDEKVTRAFEQSINRIISIAMVHELMYKSPDLSSININSYLEMLIPAISTSLSDESSKINFDIDIEEIKLNITEAIPIGLLLNELITNSFKYAFNGNNEGSITIKLSETEKRITIHYEDDGKGFENNKDFNTPKNLGLNLVHTQLQQLEAEYEVDTDSKFRLEFTFPISKINSEH